MGLPRARLITKLFACGEQLLESPRLDRSILPSSRQIQNSTDLEDTDVSHFSTCSRRARQPEFPGTSLRAADPARGIGRRRSFGDQRRAIWSRQSQVTLGPQRHWKCLGCATAPYQLSGLHELSRASATFPFTRRRAALCRGDTAVHHCACH
jgi:hypothetical protein